MLAAKLNVLGQVFDPIGEDRLEVLAGDAAVRKELSHDDGITSASRPRVL